MAIVLATQIYTERESERERPREREERERERARERERERERKREAAPIHMQMPPNVRVYSSTSTHMYYIGHMNHTQD
jgi:septal ring factor EnvC (AmiA/AmiB activator)